MEEKYIADRYQESFDFLQDRKKRQANQLVLLNNLQRGDENISSSLLLTLFNRVMSNLYDDKMQVKFVAGEEIDNRRIDAMNLLAQNDYREMDKAVLDYDWSWDSLFFGDGWCETLRFDKARKLMKPHIINSLVFQYDPYFSDPQEWRYYSKWITKSRWQIQKLIDNGTLKGISSPRDIPSGVDPYLWDYKVTREQARKLNTQAPDTLMGDIYQILEFFGYDDDGERAVFWIDRGFSKILYEEKLDLQDGEKGLHDDKPTSQWPIIRKSAFREPHSSVTFSVADLLDDKHRAKSVLMNLAFLAAKDKANPIYWYDKDKVQDVTQFFSRQIEQHIATKGKGDEAFGPANTQDPLPPGLVMFMQMLSQEANDPMGTGMTLNAAKKGGKQSATETAIQQQLNDLAQSLQSKVMQFGEKEFWLHWYHRYKRYTKEGEEKIATVTGVKGQTFEKIDLGDIHTKYPPGVLIFSAKEAEYKELVLRRDLMQLYPQFQQSLTPDGMRNFNKYVFFPKFLHDPTIVDIIIPKTLDEIKAEEENDALGDNKLPEVSEVDNHEQHIAIHYMAKKTHATWLHIAWHEELLGQQKQMKMQSEQQQMQGEQGDKPKVGAQKSNPQEAAAPLKAEINPKDKVK